MDTVIYQRLMQLQPISLEILDESHKHQGHLKDSPTLGTHLSIKVIATCFEGLSRISRHKIIYDLLEQELKTQIHALSIKAFAPNEVIK